MNARKLACIIVAMCALAMPAPSQEARKAIDKPTPHYPQLARRIQLAGTVKIEVVIGTDGKIKEKETKVIGGHPILVQAALDALRDWKYEPSKFETTATLTFDFHP